MAFLAKSIADPAQIMQRKEFEPDGIEVLLLGRDFEDLNKTREILLDAAKEYPIVALETPDFAHGHPINPVALDSGVREKSREFLEECVMLGNYLEAKTGKVPYLQYQLNFDRFGDKNVPHIATLSDLGKIGEFHAELKAKSIVPLQMENSIPINPSGGIVHHCYLATRPSDFERMGIPMALDVTHLAQSLRVWSAAESRGDRLYEVKTNQGIYYIQMTSEDVRNGIIVRNHKNLKECITNIIISEIKKHSKNIGSLQFADAKVGFGLDDSEAGYMGEDGMIDIPRVMREAVLPAGIPYVVPEYKEGAEYNTHYVINPDNQRKAFALLRSCAKSKVA